MQSSVRSIFAVVLALTLCACGGNKNAAQSPSPSPSAPELSPPAGAMSTMATVPPNLNCGAVKPVWVNLRTKKYHEPGDPMYGMTKHGEYLCPSQAAAQGFKRARP